MSVVAHGIGNILALYGASRSLSILVVAVGAAVLRSKSSIAAMALVMTLVQLGDAIVGVLSHDTSKTIGPLILAFATSVTLVTLLRTSKDGSPNAPYS